MTAGEHGGKDGHDQFSFAGEKIRRQGGGRKMDLFTTNETIEDIGFEFLPSRDIESNYRVQLKASLY
jgi:hypothetical protein